MAGTLIPGVYTSYELSGVRYSGGATGSVGMAVYAANLQKTGVMTFYSEAEAAVKLGAETAGAKLTGIILNNGASKVKIAVTTANTLAGYKAAFELLAKEPDVKIIVCDTTDANIHAALKSVVESETEERKYRIGIVEGTGTKDDLVSRSAALNCARIVLLTPASENNVSAAAFAGLVAGTEDPALPYSAAVLKGVVPDAEYTLAETESLIAGGVTVLARTGTSTEVIRAVTTRTKNGSVPDASWRDLNTVLVVDDVIPHIRNVLKSMFTRSKNTQRTRGAVRTQTVIELEKKRDAGIIESYGNVTVKQDENDPAVCCVSFEFTPACGMHQIILSAHITV